MPLPLVSYRLIPTGDLGAVATLATMRELVTQASHDRWAVAVAQGLIPPGVGGGRISGGGTAESPDEIIEAIREFFDDRFLFHYDPFAMDRVSSPVLLLQELVSTGRVRGDCDDAAVLAAFLGTVRGVPYRFRAVGFSPTGPLTHVYTLLRGSTGPIPLDVTRNPKQVVPAARRVLDYPPL